MSNETPTFLKDISKKEGLITKNYSYETPHFVIDDIMLLQKQQIQLQKQTNDNLLIQIEKEQDTNALLTAQLAQTEQHNKELQDKLNHEIIKNKNNELHHFRNEVIIGLVVALLTWISSQLFTHFFT